MQITDALKNLYKKVTGVEAAPESDQIADIIQAMADEWPEPAEPTQQGTEETEA